MRSLRSSLIKATFCTAVILATQGQGFWLEGRTAVYFILATTRLYSDVESSFIIIPPSSSFDIITQVEFITKNGPDGVQWGQHSQISRTTNHLNSQTHQ